MSLSVLLPSPNFRRRLRKSHRKNSFRRRCSVMLKQHKTRFYILGRCISMLLCWNDGAD